MLSELVYSEYVIRTGISSSFNFTYTSYDLVFINLSKVKPFALTFFEKLYEIGFSK